MFDAFVARDAHPVTGSPIDKMSMEVYQMWSYKEKAERVAMLFAQEQAMADPGVRQPIFIVLNCETDLAVVRKEIAKFWFANVVLFE